MFCLPERNLRIGMITEFVSCLRSTHYRYIYFTNPYQTLSWSGFAWLSHNAGELWFEETVFFLCSPERFINIGHSEVFLRHSLTHRLNITSLVSPFVVRSQIHFSGILPPDSRMQINHLSILACNEKWLKPCSAGHFITVTVHIT